MGEPIENEYFNWLCAKVLAPYTRSYHELLKILHSTEFVWVIQADRHRADDGVELRQDFQREHGLKRDRRWEAEPCSIFEMMVAFANRASFQTDTPVKEWFWIFMTNLYLDQYRHVSESDMPLIENTLTTFVWRTYEPNGSGGGMFPMRQTQNDQREIEIWYQFCEYIDEFELY